MNPYPAGSELHKIWQLGFDEADSDVGMTYDNDPESERSRAYDLGRNAGQYDPKVVELAAEIARLLGIVYGPGAAEIFGGTTEGSYDVFAVDTTIKLRSDTSTRDNDPELPIGATLTAEFWPDSRDFCGLPQRMEWVEYSGWEAGISEVATAIVRAMEERPIGV